ncbi:MAG: AsmA family protein, partial [Betaproteobacteria bacterium]
MPLWLRRVLWGVAALLIVLVAAALWLVTTFDANRYKGVAIDWVKTHRNRTLTIDGPIELSVFPRLAVRLSQLRVSEVGKPDEFAALDDAGLAVDLLPLLRGELVVGRVQAKGVRVAYFRDAKGRSNVDDLLHPAAPTEPATRRPLRFDISSVDLADVRARVKDDANGVNGEILLK